MRFEFRTRAILTLVAASMLFPSTVALADPTAAPQSCEVVLGFATLRDVVGPRIVGDCLENERHNAENGDAVQQTTGGLLVWRKSDNWSAFSNGAMTWVDGPYGVQQRSNADRFAWEVNAPSPE